MGMYGLQFDPNEFILMFLGTDDLARVLIGLVFAFLGTILMATGKIAFSGENKTPDPHPDPNVLEFVYRSRKMRFVGAFIIVLFVIRIFAPSLTNTTLLLIFTFSTGFLGYLLTDWAVNFIANGMRKFLPNFKISQLKQTQDDNKP